MGRPTDWQPLADSDPVPGDPAGISAEAAHLSGVAQLIAGQVGQLRKIAAGHSDERGQHADKLKSAASDTAGQLDKVVGRYQKTAAALTSWVPELEYAQSQSLKALAAAQEAAGRQRANQPADRPSGSTETAQDKQDDQARQKALNQANSDLAAARAMLDKATSYRDQKAGDTASKIGSAISGDKDSFWDDLGSFFSSIGDWIKNNWVPLLKDICTGLEILATVLAVVCLFIPGLNIVDALLLVAFGASLLAAMGRGVLAATGNGSWLDFGLDVVACLTFGASRIFGSALETAADGAAASGRGLVAGERASTAAEYVTKYFGNTVGRLIGEGKAGELAAQWAAEAVPDLALDGAKAPYLTRFANAIKAGGSLDDWEHFSKIAAVYARYGDNPVIGAAMDQGKTALNTLRVAAGFSWGGALSGLIGGGGEMDGSGGPVFRVTIPGISSGWDWVEEHATAPLPGFQVASGGGG